MQDHEFSNHKFSLKLNQEKKKKQVCFPCAQISKELSVQQTEVAAKTNCSKKHEVWTQGSLEFCLKW